jgi:membrane-bound serine protease (ClpP class)
MDNTVVWAVAFLGVALVLFFVEIFIPSGGLIGFAAAASLVAGIVMLFQVNTTLGLVGAIVALVGLPFLFALALKIWPNTPMARLLLLKTDPRATEDMYDGAAAPGEGPPSASSPSALVGVTGEALTDLRPVGVCMLEGQRVECLADGGLIRAGSAIRVVAVDGMHIKVRPRDET